MAVLTREEQETVLISSAASSVFEVSSADPAIVRKLERLANEFPEVYIRGKVTDYERSYIMPKRLLRFGRPASEARREANRRNGERLSGMRPFVKHSDLKQDG